MKTQRWRIKLCNWLSHILLGWWVAVGVFFVPRISTASVPPLGYRIQSQSSCDYVVRDERFTILSNRVSTDPLLSVNRYVLVLFPMYFALGSLHTGRTGQRLLFAVGLLSSLAISGMFFMWKWVG